MCVVVHDIAFTSYKAFAVHFFKDRTKSTFDVKQYNSLTSFIRWRITRTPHAIFVNQKAYRERLLKHFGMHNCNPVQTSLPLAANIEQRCQNEESHDINDHHRYQSLIGGLAYLAHCERPDLMFSASALSGCLHDPPRGRLSLAKRLCRYLSGTMLNGMAVLINVFITTTSIWAVVDADWRGCKDTQRLTTGSVFAVNGAPICWKSKMETIISLSLGEAEYVAFSERGNAVTRLEKSIFEILQ